MTVAEYYTRHVDETGRAYVTPGRWIIRQVNRYNRAEYRWCTDRSVLECRGTDPVEAAPKEESRQPAKRAPQDQVAELVAKGWSSYRIAEALGLTQRTAYRQIKAVKLGQSPRKWPKRPDVTPAEVYRLHAEEHWTQKQIALHFGITVSAVFGKLEKHRRTLPGPIRPSV